VSFVHNGNPPQINMVRVDGGLAVLMPIQTSGSPRRWTLSPASKNSCPSFVSSAEGVEMTVVGDQTAFISER